MTRRAHATHSRKPKAGHRKPAEISWLVLPLRHWSVDEPVGFFNRGDPSGKAAARAVCVGSCLQGGSYGFTSVTFGMNCDNVIDMRVMRADGRIVVAGESVNRDLS